LCLLDLDEELIYQLPVIVVLFLLYYQRFLEADPLFLGKAPELL